MNTHLAASSVLLSSQELTAEGHHAEQHLDHFLHHIDLPPQNILILLAVTVHSNVETLVKLEENIQ